MHSKHTNQIRSCEVLVSAEINRALGLGGTGRGVGSQLTGCGEEPEGVRALLDLESDERSELETRVWSLAAETVISCRVRWVYLYLSSSCWGYTAAWSQEFTKTRKP